MATSLSGVLQSTMLIYYLRKKYDLDLYLAYFVQFAWRFLVQLMCVMSVVYAGHRAMFAFIASYVRRTDFLLYGIGFWLWTIPFMVLTFVLLYVTRSWFKLRLHFLDNAF
jgi:peptidoglycan biosynthesis protein MviN/MurJ (putative lipid II flippase)